ncbi:MAG: autotransporter outer membrane beta-barrel domain-containing protein [Pseudomonadota bacterium]
MDYHPSGCIATDPRLRAYGYGLKGALLLIGCALCGATQAAPLPDQLDPDDSLRQFAELLDSRRDEDSDLGRLSMTLRDRNDRALTRRVLLGLRPELGRQVALRRRGGLTRNPTATRRGRTARRHGRPQPERWDAAGPAVHRSNLTLSLNGLSAATGSGEPRAHRGGSLWLTAIFDEGEQDERDDVPGYDESARGFRVGYGVDLTPSLQLALSGGRMTADIDSTDRGTDDVESTNADVALTWSGRRQSVTLTGAFADHATDRIRPFEVPTADGPRLLGLRAEIDSRQWGAGATWSAFLASDGGWYANPFVGLDYGVLQTDNYEEVGLTSNAFALQVVSADDEQLFASIGATVGHDAVLGDWLFSPSISVTVEHALIRDETETSTRFRNSDFGFTATGFDIEPTRFSAGVSMSLLHLSGISLQAGVRLRRYADYRFTGLSATLSYLW